MYKLNLKTMIVTLLIILIALEVVKFGFAVYNRKTKLAIVEKEKENALLEIESQKLSLELLTRLENSKLNENA